MSHFGLEQKLIWVGAICNLVNQAATRDAQPI
jgi:hypothetical protein